MRRTRSLSDTSGLVSLLGSENLQWIARFDRLALRQGDCHQEEACGLELGVIVLLGTQRFSVGADWHRELGGRESLWTGRPSVLYVPPGQPWRLEALSDGEIVVCGAPASPARAGRPCAYAGSEIEETVVGRENWRRIVRIVLGKKGETQHLLLGECINPPGNWSGTPPHRHMGIEAGESCQEEAYYFRCSDPQGWGIERTWWQEKGVDRVTIVKDGTATVIPYGYHQVVAAPGYWLDYVFCMAGPVAQPSPLISPEHAWLTQKAGVRPGFESLVQILSSCACP